MNTDNPSKDALLINIQCLSPGGTPGKEDENKQGVPSDRTDAISRAGSPFSRHNLSRSPGLSQSPGAVPFSCFLAGPVHLPFRLPGPASPPSLPDRFLTSIARTLPQKTSSTEKSPPQEGLLLLLRQTSSSSSSFPGRLPPPPPPP